MHDLSGEHWPRLEQRLELELGLNPQSVGRQVIAAALQFRMTTLGLTAPAAYLEQVLTNRSELDELIEELVVPETWFFRDATPFWWLRDQIVAAWQTRPRTGKWRVLSAPCSSGEETYSLAMILLHGGLPPESLLIDGVDISRRSLSKAEAGVYQGRSFREQHTDFTAMLPRFFVSTGAAQRVNDHLRSTVRFRRGNIAASSFLASEGSYDLILCRNLFIYLHRHGRQTVLTNLHRMLTPDGVLIVGHADLQVSSDRRFCLCDPDYPFAFRRADVAAATPIVMPPPIAPPLRKTMSDVIPANIQHASAGVPRSLLAAESGASSQETPSATNPPSSTVAQNKLWDAAQQAADSGRLAEAEALCCEHLATASPTAAAFSLLGVVQQARGNSTEAERSFHKALYLDPRHDEALVHLLLLAQQRGDEQLVQHFKNRVSRHARAGA